MAWLHLVITIACFSIIPLFLKLGGRKGSTPLALTFAVFIVSAFVSGLILAVTGISSHSAGLVMILGASGGICGALAFLLFVQAIKIGHYGYTVALLPAISSVIPVLFAILLWHEPWNVVQLLGLSLFFLGVALIASHGSSLAGEAKIQWKLWLACVAGAFLLDGVFLTTQALVAKIPGSDYMLYLFVFYCAGSLVLLPNLLKSKALEGVALLWGAGGAVGSLAGGFCTLKALEGLSSVIVFPVSLNAPLIIGVIISRFMFDERIGRNGYLGLACGVVGICMSCFK